jgi:hypothetical protein
MEARRVEADGIPETGAQRIGLTLRLAGDGDVRVLRALVNQAYHELAEMGLNLTGTYQDEDITRERMQGKEVFLAYLGDTVAGTISLEAGQSSGEERILYLNQLAVTPAAGAKASAVSSSTSRRRRPESLASRASNWTPPPLRSTFSGFTGGLDTRSSMRPTGLGRPTGASSWRRG